MRWSGWRSISDVHGKASGVYVLLDDDSGVVYVGQSINVASRVSQHRSGGELTFATAMVYLVQQKAVPELRWVQHRKVQRWPMFARCPLAQSPFRSPTTLDLIEWYLTQTLLPVANGQYSPRANAPMLAALYDRYWATGEGEA